MAAGFLDAHDIVDGRQSARSFRQQVARRTLRHVVQNQRQRTGFGNRPVVLAKAVLRGFVVVRRHQQAGIRARLFRSLGLMNGFRCGVAAGARNHRHLASNHTNGALDNIQVLLGG